MNEQELISHIEELGLSNKEARVYVACLTVGPSPVQRIADQAGIKRVTAYVILESLVGLGLVSQSVKGKKTFFIAEDPTNLERLLEKREHELKEQKSNFENILPELLSLKSLPKESLNVQFYDSADGIRTIFKSFLRRTNAAETKYVCGVSNLDQLYAFFPDLKMSSQNPERARVGLKSRFIYTSTDGPILKLTDSQKDRESRFMPLDKFPMVGDFTIVGDHILLLSLNGRDPIGVTITSSEIANGFRALFDLAWASAADYNK